MLSQDKSTTRLLTNNIRADGREPLQERQKTAYFMPSKGISNNIQDIFSSNKDLLQSSLKSKHKSLRLKTKDQLRAMFSSELIARRDREIFKNIEN